MSILGFCWLNWNCIPFFFHHILPCVCWAARVEVIPHVHQICWTIHQQSEQLLYRAGGVNVGDCSHSKNIARHIVRAGKLSWQYRFLCGWIDNYLCRKFDVCSHKTNSGHDNRSLANSVALDWLAKVCQPGNCHGKWQNKWRCLTKLGRICPYMAVCARFRPFVYLQKSKLAAK